MQNLELKELCKSILNKDPSIRYVGVISIYGRTLAGKMREGLRPLFKNEEAASEFFLTGVRELIRKNFEESIGKHILTLTIHEKVNLVQIPTNKYVVYISFDKNTSIDKIINIAMETKEILLDPKYA